MTLAPTGLRPIRLLLALAAAAVLAGCTGAKAPESPVEVEQLGAFKLGYVIVVADNAQKVQPSRDVSPDVWEKAIKDALTRRFAPMTGDQFYHVAVAVRGYSVAVPGLPVVASPKSVVVVEANVWDDAKRAKINAEPKQFTVLESVDANSVVGSGLTKTKEQQVANLAENVAGQVEKWMRSHPEWFAERE